jgi:hypothetical protein
MPPDRLPRKPPKLAFQIQQPADIGIQQDPPQAGIVRPHANARHSRGDCEKPVEFPSREADAHPADVHQPAVARRPRQSGDTDTPIRPAASPPPPDRPANQLDGHLLADHKLPRRIMAGRRGQDAVQPRESGYHPLSLPGNSHPHSLADRGMRRTCSPPRPVESPVR